MAAAVWICVECSARCPWLSKVKLTSKSEDVKNLNYLIDQNANSWSEILCLILEKYEN